MITKYLSKIRNYLTMLTFQLLGILLIFLTLTSFLFTTYYGLDYAELPLYKRDNFILLLFVFILTITVLILFDKYYGLKKLNTKKLLIGLFLYVLIIGFFWIFFSCSIPNADQNIVSTIATAFCDNNFDAFNKGGYLYIYPFQLGMVALLELIYRIIGKDQFLAFQFLNVISICIAFYGMFKITNIFFNDKKTNNIFLLLMFFCFPIIMYSTFVYGTIMSFMFCIIAIWTELEYLNKNKGKYFLVSTLCISFAIIIKSNSMIVLIAMIIMFLLDFLKMKRISRLLLPIILILTNFMFGLMLNGFYQTRSGIKINSGAPKLLWIAMGLQEGPIAPGWWNGYSYNPYVETDFDYNKTTDQAKVSITNSMINFKNNKRYAVHFFYYKFASQWNDPTYQSFWISQLHDKQRSTLVNSFYYGKLHELSIYIMNTYQFIIFLSALSFIIFRWNKSNINETFLAIIILGGFLFHMLWEGKGQYIVTYFTMFVPYSAAGIKIILDKSINIIRKA